MRRKRKAEIAALVEAAKSARFALHCELLGYDARPDTDPVKHEGIEICSEVMVELARAVAPFDPEQVACSGCADRDLLFGPAKDIADFVTPTPQRRERE